MKSLPLLHKHKSLPARIDTISTIFWLQEAVRLKLWGSPHPLQVCQLLLVHRMASECAGREQGWGR